MAKLDKGELNSHTAEMLDIAKNDYERFIKSCGSTSAYTITFGLEYAKMLRNSARGIEVEQLFMKLAADSRRVHGPEHYCTKCAYKDLELCKMRWVSVSPVPDDNEVFQAL